MKKALIIQHEESTPPGSVIDWLNKNEINFEIYFFSQNKIINPEDFCFCFVLGGGMNVDQELDYPWLIEEKKFIKNWIDSNKQIVGLCLGGQLISEILGGKVFKAAQWEVGWYPVKMLQGCYELMAFHWHGYQFTIPDGARLLSYSEVCPNQMFKYGDNVLAFQFHPEANFKWVTDCSKSPNLPVSSESVQTREEIIEGLIHVHALETWFHHCLSQFLKFA